MREIAAFIVFVIPFGHRSNFCSISRSTTWIFLLILPQVICEEMFLLLVLQNKLSVSVYISKIKFWMNNTNSLFWLVHPFESHSTHFKQWPIKILIRNNIFTNPSDSSEPIKSHNTFFFSKLKLLHSFHCFVEVISVAFGRNFATHHVIDKIMFPFLSVFSSAFTFSNFSRFISFGIPLEWLVVFNKNALNSN